MVERMLNKKIIPSLEEMVNYCDNTGELFTSLNKWLTAEFHTEQEIKFPYGNQYGWCISHKKKKKLICNIFPESGTFTIMLRLSNAQFEVEYKNLQPYMQHYIDNKFPCSEGGWIHYRVSSKEHIEDIKKLLTIKCIE